MSSFNANQPNTVREDEQLLLSPLNEANEESEPGLQPSSSSDLQDYSSVAPRAGRECVEQLDEPSRSTVIHIDETDGGPAAATAGGATGGESYDESSLNDNRRPDGIQSDSDNRNQEQALSTSVCASPQASMSRVDGREVTDTLCNPQTESSHNSDGSVQPLLGSGDGSSSNGETYSVAAAAAASTEPPVVAESDRVTGNEQNQLHDEPTSTLRQAAAAAQEMTTTGGNASSEEAAPTSSGSYQQAGLANELSVYDFQGSPRKPIFNCEEET